MCVYTYLCSDVCICVCECGVLQNNLQKFFSVALHIFVVSLCEHLRECLPLARVYLFIQAAWPASPRGSMSVSVSPAIRFQACVAWIMMIKGKPLASEVDTLSSEIFFKSLIPFPRENRSKEYHFSLDKSQ